MKQTQLEVWQKQFISYFNLTTRRIYAKSNLTEMLKKSNFVPQGCLWENGSRRSRTVKSLHQEEAAMNRAERRKKVWDNLVSQIVKAVQEDHSKPPKSKPKTEMMSESDAWSFELQHMAAFGVSGVMTY